MSEWARKEVEIACKKENPDWDMASEQFDYGCYCYKSALDAYLSLVKDNHSGMSFRITASILERLLHELPLTPIEDTPDIWNSGADDETPISKAEDGTVSMQCKRRFSLFKEIHPDGSVTYHDVDRLICCNDEDKTVTFHDGLASQILDEWFPIKMPYFPEKEKYVIDVSHYLTDRKNGDYDTVAYWRMTTPGGEVLPINWYYGEIDGEFQRIDREQLKERVILHNKREKEEEYERECETGDHSAPGTGDSL